MSDYNSIFHVSKSGRFFTVVSATPTLTVHAAYVAGDYVGQSGVATVITNAVRVAAGGGDIARAFILDAAKQNVSLEVWYFDSDPTPPADSAAWDISDANMARLVAIVPVSTWYSTASNSVGVSDVVNQPFVCAAGSRDLYMCIVNRGAPAAGWASGDLTVYTGILQS